MINNIFELDKTAFVKTSLDGTSAYVSVFIARRAAVSSAELRIQKDGEDTVAYSMRWIDHRGGYDVFTVPLDLSYGLYFYKIAVDSALGFFFVGEYDKVSYSEDDIASDQLSVCRPRTGEPDGFCGGLMYHIFIDRFNRGRCSPEPSGKDKVFHRDWYNDQPVYASRRGKFVKNNDFFGGDFDGITEKLGYLESLGVSVIYLSPISEAYSNHKYDTGDYMKIDGGFGGEDAFRRLVGECRKHGIKIILDGVFNHTGDKSVYFNKDGGYGVSGACRDKTSRYYKWFDFYHYPDKYRCWWDIDILPSVDTSNEDYIGFIAGEDGVVDRYMKLGASGYRLDVADELNEKLIREIKKRMRSVDPGAILIGEVWEDASNKIAYSSRRSYFIEDELDSVMDYPVRTAIINSLTSGDFTPLKETLETLIRHYPRQVVDSLMNSLSTHDTERILTVLSCERPDDTDDNRKLAEFVISPEGRDKAEKLAKIAYALLYTLPGIPCVYYGDEAGMYGFNDPFNRMPYPWGKENAAMITYFKRLGSIRKNPVFKNGDYNMLECKNGIFAFSRSGPSGSVVTAANISPHVYELPYPVRDLISGRKITKLHPMKVVITDEIYYDTL